MLNILFERISSLFMGSLNGAIGLKNDYELWEYLLVAYPDEIVRAKIFTERKNVENKYDLEEDGRFHPHITVANFLAKEAMEETFIRWIQNVCNLQRSFVVTLNNYGGFPSSGLYLRVQTTEPFKRLTNALKILDGFMESNDCPAMKLVDTPHITFVTGLSEYSFNNVIQEYARKTLHESFNVDKLILLKRDADRRSQLINTFILPPPLPLCD